MPISLSSFGLPSGSKNILSVKRDLQTNLPQPVDPNIAALASKLVGSQTPSILSSKDQSILRAASSSLQIDAKKSKDIAMWLDVTKTGVELVNFLQDKGSSTSGYGETEKQGVPGAVTVSKLIKQSDSNAAIQPANYGLPRISWQLTTDKRMMLGETPLYFYVNSDQASFGFEFVEALDLVQKGYFLTQWKDTDGNSYFPAVKVGFNLQTSSLLTETYATKDSAVNLPPGLKNFYDILGLVNEPKMIDVRTMAEEDENFSYAEYASWDGKPNMVHLTISTRTFPKITLIGYFTGSFQPQEDANNPLSMKIPLQFIALDSDPHWWDVEELTQTYTDFYSASSSEMMSITDLASPWASTSVSLPAEQIRSIPDSSGEEDEEDEEEDDSGEEVNLSPELEDITPDVVGDTAKYTVDPEVAAEVSTDPPPASDLTQASPNDCLNNSDWKDVILTGKLPETVEGNSKVNCENGSVVEFANTGGTSWKKSTKVNGTTEISKLSYTDSFRAVTTQNPDGSKIIKVDATLNGKSQSTTSFVTALGPISWVNK
jgi:hypothetical protein